MAWTKTDFYISLLFTVIILFSGLGIVGTSLSGSDRIDLNDKSYDYIAQLKGDAIGSGYTNVSESETAEQQSKGILDSEDDLQVDESSDFLSTLFIKKERASAPTNFFKIAYNLPTTILIGLGLPLSDFQYVTSTIVYILVIALLILIWVKFIRT